MRKKWVTASFLKSKFTDLIFQSKDLKIDVIFFITTNIWMHSLHSIVIISKMGEVEGRTLFENY